MSVNSISLMLSQHSRSKNGLLGAGVIFLLIAIYLAASWGTTHVSVIQPRQVMTLWENNKQPFNKQKWKTSIEIMEAAIESNPTNASNYFDLARLYDWIAYQKPIWDKDTTSYRTKAVNHYKKALEYRPTWSSAWINLAMSKTLNMEFGDEVKTALDNAMTYGAWESGVFERIVWLSFANWDGLSHETQEKVKSLIKKTINNQGKAPLHVQQVAEHFDWQEELKEVIKSSRKSEVISRMSKSISRSS